MSPLVLTFLMAAAGTADGPTSVRQAEARAQDEAPKASILHFGMGIDAGVPNGAGITLVGRPWHFLRLHGGVAHNVASTGVQGGLSLIPFKFYVTPALTLEGGQFFRGGSLVDRIGIDPQAADLVKHVTYRYASLHLGLEFGSPRSFTFYIHAGVSRMWGAVHDVTGILSNTFGVEGLTSGDARVVATVPSAKVGLFFYFL